MAEFKAGPAILVFYGAVPVYDQPFSRRISMVANDEGPNTGDFVQ